MHVRFIDVEEDPTRMMDYDFSFEDDPDTMVDGHLQYFRGINEFTK